MKSAGVRMVAVSVDPPELSRRVVEKNGLDFSILSDGDAGVIRSYGLLHSGGGPDGGDLAIPAHLLIDRDGRILWRRVATRIQDRPTPQEVLDAVRR